MRIPALLSRIRDALTPKHGRDINDDDVEFTPEQLRMSPVPPALAASAAYLKARNSAHIAPPAPPMRKVGPEDPLAWWRL